MSINKIHPIPGCPVRDSSISVVESDFGKSDRPDASSDDEELPPLIRKEGISAKMTFLNFLKGMIGTGCLSLPLALKKGGLWAGLFLIVVCGFLNNYCTLQLVHCSQYLSRKKGNAYLDYGPVASEACSGSFMWVRPYKNIARITVDVAVIVFQIGICIVLYIFVAVHIQEIVEQYWSPGLSKHTYMLIILIPFILINFSKNLKIITIISLMGNVLMMISLAFIFQYLIQQPHQLGSLPWISDFDGIMMATGSIMYAFEGQAIILPLENKLKYPEKMVGPFGVLSLGSVTITFAYASCGFLGYITYGDKAKGSVTLNLPEQPQFTAVKILLVLVVYFSFVIEQYVIVETTWPVIKTWISETKFFSGVHQNRLIFPELVYRAFLVVLAMGFAMAIPNLEQIIPLVGITAGVLLAFVFPPAIDCITFLPGMFRKLMNINSRNPTNSKDNTCLLILGIFGCIAGLQSSIRDLIGK
ncbi:hypothetical protein FO519_009405 [Halicephalobus sp. NKZ332]|nr:hypothetical protein FO519_009405 [Halicephalobus sp. NKZ332]